jgi:hypothetical protein
MIEDFIEKVQASPAEIAFTETMQVIDAHYAFTPTAFKNGELENEAGQNNGSCKLFAFAMMHELSESQTLACFGDYYREEVLGDLAGNSHQNIRNFMKHGWDGIEFAGEALHKKEASV